MGLCPIKMCSRSVKAAIVGGWRLTCDRDILSLFNDMHSKKKKRKKKSLFPHCHYRRYRYLAYRMFVSWVFGYLGRGVRVPLPACAVTRIRNEYPDDQSQYVGFRAHALD